MLSRVKNIKHKTAGLWLVLKIFLKIFLNDCQSLIDRRIAYLLKLWIITKIKNQDALNKKNLSIFSRILSSEDYFQYEKKRELVSWLLSMQK